MFAQKLHCLGHFAECAVAAAPVCSFLEALDADGGHEVFHAGHLLAESVVDERAVDERQEHAVRVCFAQVVFLADERLTAGVDVNMRSQLLALADDGIEVLVAEVEIVPVFCCPAAGAMQVASAGGIHQHRPGDVAAMLLAVSLLLGPCQEIGIHDEGAQQVVSYLRIEVEDFHY